MWRYVHLAALLLPGAAVLAGESDNSVTVGLGHLDDASVRITDRAGFDDDGLHLLGDFGLSGGHVADRDSGYWSIRGTGLTQDSRQLTLRHGVQGRHRVQIEYREIDTRVSRDGTTPFRPAGSAARLALPAGWQPGSTTGAMASLTENQRSAPLGVTRRTAALSWRQVLGEAWSLQTDLRRETRRGTRTLPGTAGSTGGNARAALLPAPLDYTTRDVEVRVDYARRSAILQSGYRLGVFENGDAALAWQNPFTGVAGWGNGTGYPGSGQLALEPGNRQHQAFVAGAWRPLSSVRVQADAQLGWLRQDDAYLPYTVNPALLVPQPLPRTELDGRVDTRRFGLGLQFLPAGPLSAGVDYRFDERDSDSPRDWYAYVAGDSTDQDTTAAGSRVRRNLPYSFRRERAALYGAWRWRNGMRLRGDIARLETRRDFSEVDVTQDDSLRLRLTGNGRAFGRTGARAHALNWHVEAAAERRRGDDYRGSAPWLATHTPEYVDGVPETQRFVNHPLLRKYYLADRDRQAGRLGLQWVASETLTAGFSAAVRRDDYATDAALGLNDTLGRTFTADLGWTPRPDRHVEIWVSRDDYESDQSGWSFRGNALLSDLADPGRRWDVGVRDRVDSAGFGWRGLLPLANLDGGVDYVWSLGRSAVSTRTGASLANAPVPDTVSRVQRLDVYVRYQFDDRLAIRAGWLHERGRISDWAYEDVTATTLPGVLGLGETRPDYRVNWLSLRFTYRLP